MPVAKFFAAAVGALLILALSVRPAPHTKALAYHLTITADLRNLVSVQEQYFLDSARYAHSLDELGPSRYQTSSGSAVRMIQAGDSAFKAVAQHIGLTDVSCEIEVTAANTAANDLRVEPVCTPPFKRRKWIFAWE